MSAELDIYRLYRCKDNNHDRLVLERATRPDFPNWNQAAEETAINEVDARFTALLMRNRIGLEDGSVEYLAAWEGGYPEGDVFYGDTPDIEIEVWLSFDTTHKGYFVFGIHQDEERFWKALEEMRELGEIVSIADYSRPAQLVTVLFLGTES